MLRRSLLAAPLILAALVLAGCGGSTVSKSDVDQINQATEQLSAASSQTQQQILTCLGKKDLKAETACANRVFNGLATKLHTVSATYRQAAKDTKSSGCAAALNAQAGTVDSAATLLAKSTSKDPTAGISKLAAPLQQGEQQILKACHLKLKK